MTEYKDITITLENALDLVKQAEGQPLDMHPACLSVTKLEAASWRVLKQYAEQNNCQFPPNVSEIESVLNFMACTGEKDRKMYEAAEIIERLSGDEDRERANYQVDHIIYAVLKELGQQRMADLFMQNRNNP